METAMQRMLDDLLAKREVYQNAKMFDCVATLETSIEIAQYLLEKEKEQIMIAFEVGDIQNHIQDAEDYYNQTYNNETIN